MSLKIKNFLGQTSSDFEQAVQHGGRFVMYQYTISIVVMTFRRPSNIYYVEGNEKITSGLKYSGLSLILGWWGLPWGPIYTIGSFIKNFGGGTDITEDVLNSVRGNSLNEMFDRQESQYSKE